MRVLFATGIYPPAVGGPATYVSHLAEELHKRDVGVAVVTYGEEREDGSPFPVHRVPKHRWVGSRYLAFFREARKAARGADVIYAQDPLSVGLPSLCAAKATGRPLVVKIVGDLAWEIAVESKRTEASFTEFQVRRQAPAVELFRRAQVLVARSARRVIVPSEFLKKIILGWGVDERRVSVIYNSLPESPPKQTKEQSRETLGLDGDPLLLAAGRLVPWKRFDLPMRFLRDVPGAHLVIAGSGPLEEDLRTLSRTLGLQSRVTFTGTLSHESMMLHLRASDLLLLPSTYEGFSHLLLEAMRMEAPVLASDAGGNTEVVGDSGRIVPADSPEDFGAALVELCRDRELREELGARARERARRFSWEVLVEDTLRVLQESAGQ
jgi:glycosyltransferase involved in cell wall biosynthesis